MNKPDSGKKVLIACEFSGIVREAFTKRGHDAWSCDLLPTEIEGKHIQDNVLEHLNDGWDLMIAHPPCTYLSNAGIGWFNENKYGEKAIERKRLRKDAFEFVLKLANAPINRICIENPTGWLNTHWRKADQIIQPWQFGDAESKRTCIYLKNLPKLRLNPLYNWNELRPIQKVKPKIYGYYKKGKKKGMPIYGNSYLKFSSDRWKIRSKTFQGIADAMAKQWGGLL